MLLLLRNDTGDDLPRFPLPPPPAPPPPVLLLFAVTRKIGELAAVGQSFTTDESLECTEKTKADINDTEFDNHTITQHTAITIKI